MTEETNMADDAADTEASTDAAWVTIETPLTADALLAFCHKDVERLFRINSLLKFEEWRHVAENEHHVRLRNFVNDKELETGLQVEPLADGLGTPAAEREARTDEVDQSLVQWGHDLHRYLARWNRWSRYAPWRWYMTRVWQPMTPMARRVVFLLIVITAMEFAAFLMVMTIFVLELDKFVGL
jgi:hypothetical protein